MGGSVSSTTAEIYVQVYEFIAITMLADDRRSVSRNVSNLNILVHDVINLLYYKANLFEKIVAQPVRNAAIGILKSARVVVALKYLRNFCRSLEILLINCKVELKIRWRRHSVLSVTDTDNSNGKNDNSITFTVKDTKLYVPVEFLLGRDNQKLKKPLSNGFEKSVYWNEYKTKSDNKISTKKFRYFLESNFVGVNRLFVLV